MARLDGYLQHKAGVLAQRRADFTADPAAAVVPLRAVSHCAGTTGVRPVRMDEHLVVSDSAPGLAGNSLGPSSPQMLLGALASCLVHTYLLFAALLEIPLDTVEVEVTGRLDMSAVVGLPTDAPSRIDGLAYAPRVMSPAAPEEIARLHAAVEQGCPVLNTLRAPLTITRRAPSDEGAAT
jgi:uncharacterized OsmC-like protein